MAKKYALSKLMGKLPGVRPHIIARGTSLAMSKSGVSRDDYTAKTSIRWALSHIKQVKIGCEIIMGKSFKVRGESIV